jgi:hypothetical protein
VVDIKTKEILVVLGVTGDKMYRMLEGVKETGQTGYIWFFNNDDNNERTKQYANKDRICFRRSSLRFQRKLSESLRERD